MKVIVVGGGRMGLGLVKVLDKRGDEVVLIDRNAEVFKALDVRFSGKAIAGVGFDQTVLEKAGVERCDAMVACTESDETNALIARISRNIYKVPKAIARLYDPKKADIYNSLGIQTISTTSWGIDHVSEMLSYDQLDVVDNLGSGDVSVVRIEASPMLTGRKVAELNRMGEIEVIALRRENKTSIPMDGARVQNNDVLFIVVDRQSIPSLKSMLEL